MQEAQTKVKELMQRIQHPRIGAMLALSEEVGELAKEVLEKEIYEETKDKKNIEGEAADVLISLLELANAYDIDLSEALKSRLETLKPRVKKWEKMAGILEKKRRQMD